MKNILRLAFVVITAMTLASCAYFSDDHEEGMLPPSEQMSELPPVVQTSSDPDNVYMGVRRNREQAEFFKTKVMLMASELTANLKQYNPEAQSVVVTTFVSLDDLGNSSSFGRMVSERLAVELHRAGYNVYEVRQARSVGFQPSQGEFYLTRESAQILNAYQADAVVAGTYTTVKEELSVMARMIDSKTARVVSVASTAFHLDEDPYAYTLLHGGKGGVVMAVRPLEETIE